jgi:hypothetical protein
VATFSWKCPRSIVSNVEDAEDFEFLNHEARLQEKKSHFMGNRSGHVALGLWLCQYCTVKPKYCSTHRFSRKLWRTNARTTKNCCPLCFLRHFSEGFSFSFALVSVNPSAMLRESLQSGSRNLMRRRSLAGNAKDTNTPYPIPSHDKSVEVNGDLHHHSQTQLQEAA